MTHLTVGAAAPVAAPLPAAPAPEPEPAPAAAASSLGPFLHELTASDGRADGAHLRLLFGQLAPAERPVARQALEPYRTSVRESLLQVAASSPEANLDELRRHLARLDEIGWVDDAVAASAPDASSRALAAFTDTLAGGARNHDAAARLRSEFVAMSTEDRISAASALTSFRGDESSRVQALLTANNGVVDPSEYDALRRVAAVDRPVEPWEVPQGAPPCQSLAAGM